jgi:hypothetical protein
MPTIHDMKIYDFVNKTHKVMIAHITILKRVVEVACVMIASVCEGI